MSDSVYIFGHINPDSDSICSAIGYAHLKNTLTGSRDYIPCRLGSINPQTEYILKKTGNTSPVYLSDVHIKVKDLMTKQVITIDEHEPLISPVKMIQEKRIRIIPVKGQSDKLKGMITLFSLNHHLLNVTSTDRDLKITTSVANLVKALNADILSGDSSDELFEGEFQVSVMGSYSFTKELKDKNSSDLILFTSDRNDIIMMAIEEGVKVIVITGGKAPNPEALEAARSRGTVMLVTDSGIIQSMNLGKLSIPSGLALEEGAISIHENALKSEAKRTLLESHHRGLVVVNDNHEITGIITRSDLLKSARKKVILMDHNEFSQSVSGLHDADILEVIDHHRIGNFSTDKPISYICRPCGSTCTIVTSLFRENRVDLPVNIASALLAGILMDTVVFKSPTCTDVDIDNAEYLSEITGLVPKDFGLEIFQNSSGVHAKTAHDIIHTDLKEFYEGDYHFSVSQVEVIGFDEIKDRFDELYDTLELIKDRKAHLFSSLLITDIIEGSSVLIYSGNRHVILESGFNEISSHTYEAKHIISRKKQLLPLLLSIVKNLKKH